MMLRQAKLAKYMSVNEQTIANYEKQKTALARADPHMRVLYLLYTSPQIRTELFSIRHLSISSRSSAQDQRCRTSTAQANEALDGKTAASCSRLTRRQQQLSVSGISRAP